MEKRFVVRLRKSPETVVPEDVHQAHLERMARLKQEGIVERNGPVAGGEGGILILKVEDRAAAERLVAEDPVVVGGFETPEIWEWMVRP
jgi:uncharacterized protein YciI